MATTFMTVHLLSKLCRKVRQYLGNLDLLRADLFAAAALQAGLGLLVSRQSAQGHGRDEPAAGVGMLVIQGKQVWDVQPLGAVADAVMAGRAWHGALHSLPLLR